MQALIIQVGILCNYCTHIKSTVYTHVKEKCPPNSAIVPVNATSTYIYMYKSQFSLCFLGDIHVHVFVTVGSLPVVRD